MPPKKGTKMSLNDFLTDDSTGKTSWADDIDDLPIAPASRGGYGSSRGGDYLSSMPDRADRDRAYAARDDRPPRIDVPLPDKAPYTAFLGSLSFDVTEGDIADFFSPHKIVSIRIVSDRDGKPKGFGYIEFEELDALKDALDRSGAPLAGRSIRVGVAEPPKGNDRGGFGSSAAEEASQWRRAGPLPPAEGPSRPGMGRERSSFVRSSDGSSGFDNMEVSSGGRSGFGSRFQPSPAREAPMARGPPRAGPLAEPMEPSKGEVASDWRTGKPVEAPPARRAGFGGAEGSNSRSPSFRNREAATDVDEKYASQERMGFGSKFSPTPPESPSVAARAGPRAGVERRAPAPPGPSDGAENWRSSRPAPSPRPSASEATTSPPAAAAPAERKKLDLKPRGSTLAAESSTAPAASSSNKANPFGGAKPVDVMERERQIEERLQKEREQRAAEEKARQEKVRAEKEKAPKGAPTGPKADRENPATPSGSASPKEGAAAAAAAPSETTSVAGGEEEGKKEAAAKAKSPPPTGAWGGGRKASGALALNGTAQTGDAKAAPAVEEATAGDKVTVADA